MPHLSAAVDLQHTLDLILDQLSEVVANNSSAILLLDEDQIEMVASRGYPELPDAVKVSYRLTDSPFLEGLLDKPNPVVVSGHLSDDLFYDLACYGPGCTCVNVPLRVQDRPIGLLIVNRHRKGGYTESESHLLSAFARQAALTIENVRLYQDATRRAMQLEAAARIGRQLTQLHELDRLLAETVNVIREHFGVYHTHIMLSDQASGKLVLREASGASADLIKRRGLRLAIGREGITGAVAESGQPVISNNVRLEPRYRPDELLPGTCSELAVPMRLRDEVIGVLDVQSNQLNAFHPEDVIALQLIADQVAIAIENARLFQETKGRLAAMSVLHDISLDIVAQLELSELLQTLLQRASRLVGADGAALSVYDERTDTIRTIASYQTWRDWTGTTYRPGEGVVGYVVSTGEPLIVTDYAQWEFRVDRFLPAEQPVILAVPLRWRERVVGVLAVVNRAESKVFGAEDQRLLVSFSDLAAIALKNAELYAQVKTFSHTLEEQVASRTHELEQARRQVVEKAEQAQMLLSKTVHIQEEERARIARDLHDSVTQLTIGALYELAAAKSDLDAQSTVAAREKVEMARDLLKQIEREIHQAIYDLRPTLLTGGDLLPGLERYAAGFQELLGIRCAVVASGTPVRLPSAVEVAIFRVAQEALHNVMTHAQATSVNLHVKFQPGQFILKVEDNGVGFEPPQYAESNGRHLGLVSMRERAEAIGGRLELRSAPGQGTRVTLRVALPSVPSA